MPLLRLPSKLTDVRQQNDRLQASATSSMVDGRTLLQTTDSRLRLNPGKTSNRKIRWWRHLKQMCSDANALSFRSKKRLFCAESSFFGGFPVDTLDLTILNSRHFPDVEEDDADQPPAPKKRRGRRGPFLTGGKGICQVPGSEKDMFQCRAVMRWQPPMQSLASFGNNCKRRKRRSKPPSMSETWVVLTAQNQMTGQW